MIDVYDIVVFILFGGILAIMVQVVIILGTLPYRIAQERGHPQAAAINIASWLGIATLVLGASVASGAEAVSFTAMGFLWPFALVCAYLRPTGSGPAAALQSGARNQPGGKEVAS